MYKVKIKMIPEQWLPLKVKVLLGYKMKTVIKWGWRINLC